MSDSLSIESVLKDISWDALSRLDKELLLAHVLGVSRAHLHTFPKQKVQIAEINQFKALVARKQAGEPLAYLVGVKEFWSLPLTVCPSVLIPRPETECLVETVLGLKRATGPDVIATARVLDLGTGSGAIALALAHERPDWAITAVDISAEALNVAALNANALNIQSVSFVQSDWFSGLPARQRSFDIIVGNPPYIEPGDPHLSDLSYEPRTALVSSAKGLSDLKRIITEAPRYLVRGGWLCLEHGYNQAEAVRYLFKSTGFHLIESRQDLAGIERITIGLL